MSGQRTVTITDNATGKSVECPVHEGEYGVPVIDLKALYKDLGMFTLDVGFGATASCRSAITYLDGEQGVLLHRGYPIEQLAAHSSFVEVCYLLVHGELPNADELAEWVHVLKMHGMTHEHLSRFYSGYRYDAHPNLRPHLFNLKPRADLQSHRYINSNKRACVFPWIDNRDVWRQAKVSGNIDCP